MNGSPPDPRPGSLPVVEEQSPGRRLLSRVGRHVTWAREQGLRRLVEEDDLDPFRRTANAIRKARWRRSHAVEKGTARPVFLVGVQRSGTNMVVRGIETSPEVEVHNENDHRAFQGFRLRDDAVVRELVRSSRHDLVLFKPLCDSHRVDELLDGIGPPGGSRAIWVYRSVDGRVRSALSKFGDVNLRVLRDIAAGRGLDRWQAQRLSPESVELIAGFDYDRLGAASAAALFWFVRNSLFFDLGLEGRADVAIVSYDGLVTEPERRMEALCGQLGFPFHPRLVAHIDRRSISTAAPLEIDQRVRRHCDQLAERLDAVALRPF